jgi:hypothetical protein
VIAVGAMKHATAPKASRSAANQTFRCRSFVSAKRLLNGTTRRNANRICTPGARAGVPAVAPRAPGRAVRPFRSSGTPADTNARVLRSPALLPS